MSAEDVLTPEVLAERAARAIAEMYTGWGPGPLPWTIAERFVAGALDVCLLAERRRVARYLRAAAEVAGAAEYQTLANLASAIERGEHRS